MTRKLFGQFRSPTVPLCVSSYYRVRTPLRVLDATIEDALSFGEETS